MTSLTVLVLHVHDVLKVLGYVSELVAIELLYDFKTVQQTPVVFHLLVPLADSDCVVCAKC